MSASIHSFPTNEVRDWALFESELRAFFDGKRSPRFADEMLRRMKPIHEITSAMGLHAITIPEEALAVFQEAWKTKSGELFRERLFAEIANCEALGLS